MCFGRRARCIGYKLLILAVLCIVANILLYFPNGETRFASQHHLSKYVECLHGIVGGGFLVSIELVISFNVLWIYMVILFFYQLLIYGSNNLSAGTSGVFSKEISYITP